MPADEKYIVFKREQLDKWLKDFVPDSVVQAELLADEIPDSVVIRKQDIFAGPALHAYASSISTAIEILEVYGESFDTSKLRLEDIRTYFFEQANDADNIRSKKVPD